VKGTKFYDDVPAERGKTGSAPTLRGLGVFTLDPFRIFRTIDDKNFTDGEWTAVNHPVSLRVFGSLPSQIDRSSMNEIHPRPVTAAGSN